MLDIDYLSLIIYPIISILILYVLERKYSYKAKLVNFFGSTAKYKITLIVIALVSTFILTFVYDKPIGSDIITNTIYISYFYLVAVTKEI